MAVFAITYVYADGSESGRNEHRPGHKEHISALADRGSVLMSGPWGADETPGALILVRADSKQDALALTDADPFRLNALVADVTATEWVPMLGRLASEV
ncbi:YciI family protein [Millisia brevis]|uniref:YciI family protein n=1 Tax=Millisia brevis TaxID=264148 RepID=UPI00082BADDF|nr:YciI family protein [Millisia brevis]